MVRYVVAAVLVFVLSSTARAEEGIALEVHTGDRSPDASRLLGPILEELEHNKISASGNAARAIDTISHPPYDKVSPMPPNFAAQVDQGQKLFFSGNFEAAVGQLQPLVEAARKNSAAIAVDQSLLESLKKAMIVLALAQSRRGDNAAMTETFKELYRSFPTVHIDKGTYGPDAVTYYEQARKDVQALGMGKLTVHVAGNGVVFVDEQYRTPGVKTFEVPAGEHRVVVLTPNGQPSRIHGATVKSGGETVVEIDTALDIALNVDGWTGFKFANAQDREKNEAQFAANLANQIGARSVVIIGIDEQKGRKVIVGSLISLGSGHEIRRAQVAIEPEPSTAQKRGLAEFLINGSAVSGVEVVEVSNKQLIDTSARPAETKNDGVEVTHNRWGGWRWISLTATVGLAGAGGALFYLDGKCKGEQPVGHPCNEVYKNEPAAEILLIGAVPFAVLTVYLFATQKDAPAPTKTAWIAPTHDGAVAGFSMTW
ncbi:MAG: hypothetical protein QM831_40255 [Kofleriaceae bacterium]